MDNMKAGGSLFLSKVKTNKAPNRMAEINKEKPALKTMNTVLSAFTKAGSSGTKMAERKGGAQEEFPSDPNAQILDKTVSFALNNTVKVDKPPAMEGVDPLGIEMKENRAMDFMKGYKKRKTGLQKDCVLSESAQKKKRSMDNGKRKGISCPASPAGWQPVSGWRA